MVVSCSFDVCVEGGGAVGGGGVDDDEDKTTPGINRGTERSCLDPGSRDRRQGRVPWMSVCKKQCSSRGVQL